MRIIFFGTPDYVIPVLEKLHKYHEIVAVVTQSPKPVGRDKKVTYSAVDAWAFKKHIPRNFDYVDLPEADMGVCASFGMIIPDVVLNMFPHGILNVHPSLLPQFRGSSPIQATLIAGITTTGVSIIKMSDKLDAGPILTQFKEEVLESDTNETLRSRLFEKSAEVLVEMIPAYIEGKIKLKKQDETKASFTTMIKKENAFIPPAYLKNAMEINNTNEEWNLNFLKNFPLKPDANTIYRFIKAMSFWPVAWTNITVISNKLPVTKRLKLIKAHINEESGYLELDEVQLEGKNPTSWKLFKGSYGIGGF
ncbi:MAG: methionyl-tRNA formyltransferase [Microgenomates group bacterium]